MSAFSNFNSSIDNNMAAIHTGFPAKVLSCDGTKAKVQPLFTVGGVAAQPIDGVPVPQSVRKAETVTETVEGQETHWTKPSPPSAGDIVYCVCAEQTLGASWKGSQTDRVGGLHHQMGDAVIVAIF